ncbi:MAG: glycosyltransferase [Terricaulis sp.]|nr:glycosyltransferase [Terricaulis sp.]
MTDQSASSVTILIAAYNAEATLARAIASALAQPEIIQVIVIDDASSDASVATAAAAAQRDERVLVIQQAANAGPAAARNKGLAAAKGDWIGVLDADDYFQPGRIARLIEHAENADFIADTLLRVVDGSPEAPAAAWSADTAQSIDFIGFVESNLGLAGRPLDLGFAKPLMRRSFLEAHSLAYRDMRLGEDYELYARALALGARFVLTPAAGYVSVEREGSLSKKHSEHDLRVLRDCDDALARVRPLTPAERRALSRHRASVDNRLQWRLLINAVKARDLVAAAKTFHGPAAALYLTRQLGEQVWLRGKKRLAAR